jgi:hypothetical protein
LDEVDILVLDATFPLAEIGAAVLKQPSINQEEIESSKSRHIQSSDEKRTSSSTSSSRRLVDRQTVQYIFTTATLPNSVVEKLKGEFRDLKVCNGPGLHKVWFYAYM